MKSVKSLLVATSLVMFTLPAMATPLNAGGNYSIETNQRTLVTQAVESKEAAYAESLQLLNVAKQSSPSELRTLLKVSAFHPKELRSLSLMDGSYITVQEIMNEQGHIEYQGAVKVQYQHLSYDGR
ncbi:DUF3316 domain-containing protein [Photobacterium makurazakiensis]|uniref:DUF3316 domain-containing protein n=1 Tax=Photobacterium makurazakiensis TaxID=2910234 RepID=UPI003D144EAE